MAVYALAVALVSMGVAIYTVYRSNKAAAASILLALHQTFQQNWRQFLDAQSTEVRDYCLAELMNQFEVACAIYLDGSLAGNSKILMNDYLKQTLKLFKDHIYICEKMPSLLEEQHTFVFIKKFLRVKSSGISILVPPRWYESQ